MKCINYLSAFLLVLVWCSCSEKQEEPWISLFDGSTLSNWEIRNGTAEYIVENEQIIGQTKIGSPNTFLCTRELFSDFILQFEVLVDSTINSGVQIRSNSFSGYRDGQVHGYQIEIDPSKRAWSGGIYDEGRRGWLYNLEQNAQGRKAFENGVWNTYRIEAIKNRLVVWVNGVNTANLDDSMTDAGFIGLQVHSIQDSLDVGKEIRWRNIKIITDEPERFVSTNKITAALLKSE